MLPFILLAVAHLSAVCGAQAAESSPDVSKSVVKIFVNFQTPRYYPPWQMGGPEEKSGSGGIIAGNRILTNAHVVADQTYIQVRKAGEVRKYRAYVEFVAHELDLALIKVEDPKFFEGSRPLSLGAMPKQRDHVAAYGFPLGGDDLSVTEGTVSRIEVTNYTHSGEQFLAVQTDAAINPGNSGGPVIKDGKIVGVSFQSYSGAGAENIGYFIPVEIIRRFFNDIADGKYDGAPNLGAVVQNMDNLDLRGYQRLPGLDQGMLVQQVIFESSSWGRLKNGDVILAIDGHPIASNQTYPFDRDTRLSYRHVLATRQVGDTIPVEISRQGKIQTVEIALKISPVLIKGPIYDRRPSYFIFAGLVFTPLTRNYINLWASAPANMPAQFKFFQNFGDYAAERREVVLIDEVLSHKINEGYQNLTNMVVSAINGKPITRMQDVIEAFARPQGPYHVIEEDPQFGRTTIVFNAAQAREATREILKQQGIAADRSPDLR